MSTSEAAWQRGSAGSPWWRAVPDAVWVGLLCLVVAVAVNAVLRHQVGFSGDEAYYARIADHPAGPHNFPYAFRVGLPYLVYALPFSHAFSWEALALLAIGGAAGALFALLRQFEIDTRLAGWLTVGFAISPPLLVVLLRNGIAVDAAAIMVNCFGCLFIVTRRKLALAITLVIGATVHESCMFLIPLAYAVWADRLVDARALRDLAVVAVVPLAFYVYLRSSIVAVGEVYQPGYVGPFFTERTDVLKLALQDGGWRSELRRLALTFGPLWFVAPLALKDMRFARRGLVLVGLCAASSTLELDWGRVMFFSAPVIYAAAAHALQGRRRLAVATIVILLAMDVGYAAYMQVHGVTHGLDSTGPPVRGPVY